MSPNLLRLAYMLEFLVALVAVFEVWSQVGGQGHLDLMPWYTKLGLGVGLALVTVAGTVAAVSHERAWNAKTLACLALALLFAGGMAGVTYYYHLHENDDSDSADEGSSISRQRPAPAEPLADVRGPAIMMSVRQNHDREGVAGPLAHARGSASIGNTAIVRPSHDRQGVAGPLAHARGSANIGNTAIVQPSHDREGVASIGNTAIVQPNHGREGVASIGNTAIVRPSHDRQGVVA